MEVECLEINIILQGNMPSADHKTENQIDSDHEPTSKNRPWEGLLATGAAEADASLAAIVLGMYLALQPGVPALRKWLQNGIRLTRNAFWGLCTCAGWSESASTRRKNHGTYSRRGTISAPRLIGVRKTDYGDWNTKSVSLRHLFHARTIKINFYKYGININQTLCLGC